MPKVRSVRIRGKKIPVHTEPIVGYCTVGCKADEIYVDPREPDEECFGTFFHEFMHGWFPDLTESQLKELEKHFVRNGALRLFTVKKREGAW